MLCFSLPVIFLDEFLKYISRQLGKWKIFYHEKKENGIAVRPLCMIVTDCPSPIPWLSPCLEPGNEAKVVQWKMMVALAQQTGCCLDTTFLFRLLWQGLGLWSNTRQVLARWEWDFPTPKHWVWEDALSGLGFGEFTYSPNHYWFAHLVIKEHIHCNKSFFSYRKWHHYTLLYKQPKINYCIISTFTFCYSLSTRNGETSKGKEGIIHNKNWQQL